MVRRLIARGLVAGTVLAASIAVALAPVALAADHGVDISGFAFSPETITVAVGDTVTWTNADAQGHTATADDGSFDTGTIANGTSKSATFATAGTVGYHCKIHPQMTATVVVRDAGTAPPPTDTASTRTPRDDTPGARWIVLAIAAIGGLVIGRRRFIARAG